MDRDAAADRLVAHLRDGVLPSHLAGPAHDQQVAGPGREVVGRTPSGLLVRVAIGAWAQQPGAASAEREDGDERVVEPAQVAIAVERLAVEPVAIAGQAEAVEVLAVAVLQPAVHVEEQRVGDRVTASPGCPQPRRRDPVVVAEQALLGPARDVGDLVVDFVGALEQAAHDVDP